jgi:hypothetical protein
MTESRFWTSRVSRGRKEASIFLSKDEKRCFVEAELLLDDLSDESLIWWGILSNSIRAQSDEDNLITGRRGELLNFYMMRIERNQDTLLSIPMSPDTI